MKIFIAMLCLVLAGCQTAGTAKLDSAIKNNLPKICAAAANTHTVFLVVASQKQFKQSLINKEAAAWAAVQQFCADPGSINSQNVVVAAAGAYASYLLVVRSTQ